jgi:hypothetical protein
VHQTPGRIRIRVASRKGDAVFLQSAAEAIGRIEGMTAVASAATGSLLITGESVSLDGVRNACGDLVDLPANRPRPMSPAAQVTLPMRRMDAGLRRFTGGDVDLVSIVFIVLLFTGAYQIFRGNLRLPPWYTAFWYAFGLFTKSLLDRLEDAPPGAGS